VTSFTIQLLVLNTNIYFVHPTQKQSNKISNIGYHIHVKQISWEQIRLSNWIKKTSYNCWRVLGFGWVGNINNF
jgi:hypothetical protein